MPLSVNGISNYNYKPNFKAETVAAPKPDSAESKTMSTEAKVGIGLGLAALASIGIYYATRGRGGKVNGKEILEQTTQKGDEVLQKFKQSLNDIFGGSDAQKYLKMKQSAPELIQKSNEIFADASKISKEIADEMATFMENGKLDIRKIQGERIYKAEHIDYVQRNGAKAIEDALGASAVEKIIQKDANGQTTREFIFNKFGLDKIVKYGEPKSEKLKQPVEEISTFFVNKLATFEKADIKYNFGFSGETDNMFATLNDLRKTTFSFDKNRLRIVGDGGYKITDYSQQWLADVEEILKSKNIEIPSL